jgi:hypothetical protein
MKKIFLLLLMALLAIGSVSAQKSKQKNDIAGKWLYEAPSAPEVYTSGTLEIVSADNKYAVAFAAAGSENKLLAENVIVTNDSLKFNLFMGDETIVVRIKIIDKSKMTGLATTPTGDIPMYLYKEEKK